MPKGDEQAIDRELAETLSGTAKSRGGPRSSLVDAIFLLLLSRPMRTSEMAEIVSKEPKYISSYLSYWKSRGYVDYDMGLWFLTPKGEEYARQLAERESDERFNEYVALAQRLLKVVRQTRNDKRVRQGAGEVSGYQQFLVPSTGNRDKKQQESRASKAACVLERLKDKVDDEELDVVMELLQHYSKFGVTYLYLDQLGEALKADYQWLLKRLRGLQSKGIVYIYTDPRLGIRVGLSKGLKQALEDCE